MKIGVSTTPRSNVRRPRRAVPDCFSSSNFTAERTGCRKRRALSHGQDHRIVLGDEISPDNCRLWDIKTKEKLDKDRDRKSVVEGKSVSVRVDLGGRRIIKKKKISKKTTERERNKKKNKN